MAIFYGFAEREGGAPYNSASCIGKDGGLLATRGKLLPPPHFEGDHFTPGGDYTLFELEDVRVATLICYDAEFPEAFRQVALAGTEPALVPTALAAQWGVVAHQVIPCRAFENGIYVRYADSCG